MLLRTVGGRIDRRVVLRGRWRRRLERAVGADLGDVPIHVGPAAARLAGALGSPALALEGRVFLGADTPPLHTRAGVRLLAHELAHVAQQRRYRAGAPGTPAALAEAEAHGVARAALAGLLAPPGRAALDPREPACWEEPGHYYTVYYVLFATGVRDDRARRIAFFTQLPDEVSELDAVRAGVGLPGSATDGVFGQLYEATFGNLQDGYIGIHNGVVGMYGMGRYFSMAPRPTRPAFDGVRTNLDVQQGLHTLTGGGMEAETNGRLAILRGIDPIAQEFEFGIALHAFGDSYAHRNDAGNAMYGPVIGHGADSTLARAGRDGHMHPDGIGPHRAFLYQQYVSRLYDLFLERFPPGHRPGAPVAKEEVVRTLSGIVAGSERAADSDPVRARQIRQIRDAAIRILPGGMHPYAPENEPDVPLAEFRPRTDIVVSRAQIERALTLGRWWSQPASGFTGGTRALP